jgi:hypothetical protein
MIRVLLPLVAFVWFSAAQAANVPTPHNYPANPEMKAMFDADQAARLVDKIDWTKLDAEDAARLKRTRDMLDAGLLQSADDYYHAAFIFQHGSEPSDFLLAHVLAMAAMKRGREDASWIAAATLDRYLQTIGQSQIFGTQYRCRDGKPWMDPYVPDLVPDSTRAVVGVPIRAEQEAHGRNICEHAPADVVKK